MSRVVAGVGRVFAAALCFAGCHAAKSALPDAAAVDPCASVRCELGTHCEVRAATCDSPPCGKRGECAPDPDENPCNVVDCAAGQVCVVESGKATCAAGSDESEDESADAAAKGDALDAGAKTDGGGATAKTVGAAPGSLTHASKCTADFCPPKTMCDDLGGKARCLPLPSCDGMRCDDGSRCELVQVTCIRAPCPAQPSCVKAP